MSLRQAKFDDHWRHTFARRYPTRVTELSCVNLSCLADGNIDFRPGITVIVGANGVGKSTLAAAVAELLANCSEVAPGHRNRLLGIVDTGKAVVGTTEVTLIAKDGDTGGRVAAGDRFEGNFKWLDPSTLANQCVSQIHADQNFDDLLESITPLKLADEELNIASYLVGKKYDEFLIYEIADYAKFEIFPYFIVSSGDVQYGTANMGRGELSLLLTLWTIRALPRDAILMLEEPETHVSPRSQDCLMNVIAKFCDELGISVIITTHSPTVIRHIPSANVILLARDHGPAEVVSHPTTGQLATILSGGVSFNGALLVEDRAAKEFVLPLFEEIMPDILERFEVAVAGSVSLITEVLRAMPKTGPWLTLVGGYDGDQRNTIDTADFLWPAVFLPGDRDPDSLLKSTLDSTQNITDLLANGLHRSTRDIVVALNHIAGFDYHDVVAGLVSSLHLGSDVIRRALVHIWLADNDNRGAAEAFVSEFCSAADTLHG